MNIYKGLKYILLALLALGTRFADAKVPDWQNDKVKITIYQQLSESLPGQTFQLLIKMDLMNGWHISWDNPGDAGVPVEFKFKAPQGWTVEKIEQSTPEKFIYDGIISQYGYSKEAYYLFSVQRENKITKETNHTAAQIEDMHSGLNSDRNLSLKISWVACRDYCEPEDADFNIYLPKENEENLLNPEWIQHFEAAEKTFPQAVDWNVTAQNKNYVLSLIIDSKKQPFDLKTKPLYFIPFERHIISAAAQQNVLSKQNNQLEIIVDAEDDIITPQKGILIYGTSSFVFDVMNAQASDEANILQVKNENSKQIKSTDTLQNAGVYEEQNPLLYILLLAFAGGLILNLMPCIFPILSIKALSLAQSANRKHHWQSGMLYLSGVLSCFMVFAGILFILRRGGEVSGWGFQLQSPVFVSVMLVIFIFIFLLMLDVIKLQGRLLNVFNRFASANSFMTGFFAVLIASPCTGPFMGAAVGYALFQPAEVYFPIFISLGLGYALPFTFIEIYPGMVKKILPKPGKWMNFLKKILALPIALTCLWLSWVLYHELTVSRPPLMPPLKPAALNESALTENPQWLPYDEAHIARLISSHRPLFIDFTAKWCITCLVNEKSTLETARFAKLAHNNHITLFKADWTNRSDEIASVLQKYGRNSIPLYVFYSGKQSEPVILPQILTPGIVEKYLSSSDN